MDLVFFVGVTSIKSANTALDGSAALVLSVTKCIYCSCIGVCHYVPYLELLEILSQNF